MQRMKNARGVGACELPCMVDARVAAIHQDGWQRARDSQYLDGLLAPFRKCFGRRPGCGERGGEHAKQYPGCLGSRHLSQWYQD